MMKIFESYGTSDAVNGDLGLHRLIEALKHMFAIRMKLGDPDFVNVTNTISDMFSPAFAKQIQQKIFDNTTFPPEYYMNRYDPFHLAFVLLAKVGMAQRVIALWIPVPFNSVRGKTAQVSNSSIHEPLFVISFRIGLDFIRLFF